MRGYGDLSPNDGTLSIGYALDSSTVGDLANPPFRLKMTRERMGANDRYVLTYSLEDGTCVNTVTQTVAHVENVYVGPCSISHHTAGASLVHYGFDELTFTDTSVKGVVIIVR